MSKSNKQFSELSVVDKVSRRKFIAASSGFMLAGSTLVASRDSLAADCDRGGEQNASSDQDAGEKSDPKGCQSKNIISHRQIPNTEPVFVKKSKA